MHKRFELEELLRNERKEILYFRKYHDLNDYILDAFGGDNCGTTQMNKNRLETILKFIMDDHSESFDYAEDQLKQIIETYDNSFDYVYVPWW